MHTVSRLCHRGAVTLFACVALSACSTQESAQPEASAPAVQAAAPADAGQGGEPGGDAPELARRADQALRDQRLFLPPGDNAFELLLAAIEADPANAINRTALADLLPYAVLHVEQQTAAGDAEDAARTLALIVRADPQAPALPRLQRGLDALQASVAQEAARRTAAAALPSAPTAPAVQPAAVAAPAPLPVQAAPPPSAPTPAPTEPVAAAPAPATTLAPVSPPAPTAPPVAAAPVRMPEVVFRPALRYPTMAERRRIEGEVELEFTINTDGSVSEVRVLRSQPEGIFDREASGAMERWRFAPPAQAMRARRVLEFRLAP